jgi:hypothetical protein
MKNLLIVLLIVLVLIVIVSSLGGSLITKPTTEKYIDFKVVEQESRMPLPPTTFPIAAPIRTEEKFESVFDKVKMTNYNIEAFDNTQAYTVY